MAEDCLTYSVMVWESFLVWNFSHKFSVLWIWCTLAVWSCWHSVACDVRNILKPFLGETVVFLKVVLRPFQFRRIFFLTCCYCWVGLSLQVTLYADFLLMKQVYQLLHLSAPPILNLAVLFVLFLFLCFENWFLCYSYSCHGNQFIDQAGLRLT